MPVSLVLKYRLGSSPVARTTTSIVWLRWLLILGYLIYVSGQRGSPGQSLGESVGHVADLSSGSNSGGRGDGSPRKQGLSRSDGQRGVSGQRGLPGNPGLPGRPGSPGLPGKAGSAGLPGEPGRPGLQGQPGRPGLQGPSGSPGFQGRPGRPGLQGRPGRPGLQGQPGRPGLQGQPGRPGLQGQPGRPGLQDPPGNAGETGIPGRRGNPGRPGGRGSSWSRGLPGEPGHPGKPGTPGMPGNSGSAGNPGHPGLPGEAGLPGNPALPGLPGNPGIPGDRGIRGGLGERASPWPPRSTSDPLYSEVSTELLETSSQIEERTENYNSELPQGPPVLTTVVMETMQEENTTGSSDKPKTGYACEGSTLTIKCNEGKRISITRANYGRFRRDICNTGEDSILDWSTECISTRSLTIVLNICQDKVECWIPATNRMFGDACRSTPKYLQVEFKCVEANSPRPNRTLPPVVDPDLSTTNTSTSTTTSTTTTATPTTSTTEEPQKVSTEPMPTPPPVRVPVYCRETHNRGIEWPQTRQDQLARRPCPNNPNALAKWYCTEFGWDSSPDLSLCVSEDVNSLQEKVVKAVRLFNDAFINPDKEEDEEIRAAKESMSIEIIEEVADELVLASNKPMAETYGGDLDGLTSVMQQMVDQIEVKVNNVSMEQAEEVVGKVNQAVVKSSSNMLEEEKTASWKDLPQALQAKAATRVIKSVEDSAYQVAKLSQAPTIKLTVDVNIVVEVNVIDAKGEVQDVSFPQYNEIADSGWRGNHNNIRLSSQTLQEMGEEGLVKLIFTTYKNLEQYLTSAPQNAEPAPATKEARIDKKGAHYVDGKGENSLYDGSMSDQDYNHLREKIAQDTIVNTQIIAASINGRKDHEKVLAEPVYYTLEHLSKSNIYSPTCAFWEYSEKTMSGKWSTFGCSVHSTNTSHTVCKCSHLTNFAVLMDVTGTEIKEVHRFALSFVTYLGCLVSLVCLGMAWITFQFIKNLQCDRNTIHKNLVACLFIAELIFLAGIMQYDKPILCSIIAGVLHYFFLAAFAWMCLEGIQLYVMLIEVFEAERSRKRWYYLAGYGIPALIITIAAAVKHEGYGTENYCWLSIEGGFIWAFVGPVLAVIVVNFVMLSIAIYMMCKHARATAAWKMKQKSKLQNVRSWIKGAVVLVVLLGLTWTFGLLYVNKNTLVFAYLFTALNSLQGLFIYFFHCATNDKVQKEYKKWVRRTSWLPECVRVKYGGARASYSSTPNQSMSTGNKTHLAKTSDRRFSIEALQKLLSGRWRKRSSTTSLQKSTSVTTPGKWVYQNRSDSTPSNSRLSSVPLASDSGLSPHESAFYSEVTEDPGGYLEPVSLCAGGQTDSGIDYDGVNGELSNIEGSVCDSNYFDQICSPTRQQSVPINVEKYKIQRNPNSLDSKTVQKLAPIVQESDEEFTSEVGDFSDETLRKLAEKERMMKEYEEQGIIPGSDDSEYENESDEDDADDEGDGYYAIKGSGVTSGGDSCLKRLSSDSGNIDTASLNDLNKTGGGQGSTGELCLTDPNINIGNGGTSPPLGNIHKGSLAKGSNPSLSGENTLLKNTNKPNGGVGGGSEGVSENYTIDKLKNALSRNNEGLVTLYHGNTPENRLSKDTQEALDQHGYRLTSSDC